MADIKRCPQCAGEIDYFGSCRKCGREWSDKLEEGENAHGLPEGQQHPALIPVPNKTTARKSKFTKSKPAPEKQFAETSSRFQPWMINLSDSDTEIIRKRSLMRLEARNIYNQMGLSLRAHDSQKGTLLWLSRLWEFLNEEEKKNLAPTMERLKQGFAELRVIAQAKSAEAAKMEVALEKAHKSARRARLKQMDDAKKKEAASVSISPGQDTEGMGVPDLATIDPKVLSTLTKEDLIELAKTKLANLDQEKALKKRQQPRADEDPNESA